MTDDHGATSPNSPDSERLDSWKAIAAYLNREVRTVQRWERLEGLPVHRLRHGRLGTIYAFKSELDAWRDARRIGARSDRMSVRRMVWLAAVIAVGIAATLAISIWNTRATAPSDPMHQQRIATLDWPFIKPSPDGHRLLHQATESRHLVITDVASGAASTVVPEWTTSDFLWSRDGREIFFWTRERAGARLERMLIGGDRRQVIAGLQTPLELYGWNGSGQRLLVGNVEQQSRRIEWLDPRTKERTPLFTAPWASSGFNLSPDDRFVLYQCERDGNSNICLRRLAAPAMEHRLTGHGAADTNPLWSANGKEAFFFSNRTRTGDLWNVPIDEMGSAAAAPRLVASLGNRALLHGVGPGGEFIFSRRRRLAQVAVLTASPDASTLRLVEMPPFAEASREPFWSHDTGKLYFRTQPADEQEPLVIERDLQTAAERTFRLPAGINAWAVGRGWNERTLLFLGAPDGTGNVGLYEYQLESASPRVLGTTLPGAMGPLSVSPNGQLILLASLRPDRRLAINVVNVANGTVREVATSATRPYPQWSPNGNEIAYTDGPCLMIVSASGGPSRQVTCAAPSELPRSTFLGIGGVTWSPDGRRLAWIALNSAATRVELWVVNRDGGVQAVWPGEPEYKSWPRDPNWSPDGQQIAIGIGYKPEHDVWILRGIAATSF